MGKDKLRKFAEIKVLDNVYEPGFEEGMKGQSPLKGHWHAEKFGNNNPITLELACGKGDYTVGLARQHPNRNFIGVDIKGARIWRGAKTAAEEDLNNVQFLRTRIDFITAYFAAGEVDEIWITFPDPQPQKNRRRKRLTYPMFINRYLEFLKPGGIINLKTDDYPFYEFTLEVIAEKGYEIVDSVADIYAPGKMDGLSQEIQDALHIKTYYEQKWLKEGRTINYVSFIPKKKS